MGYSAKAVANYFLSKYRKNGITPLKLQKLVYISHGWYMAFYDEPLIHDEFAEAWPYGPVFPSLYHEFKHFGNRAITTLASEFEPPDLDLVYPGIPGSDGKTIALLEAVWRAYGHLSGTELSNLCHAAGSPWHKTMEQAGGKRNADIPDKLIADYYRVRMENNRRKRFGGKESKASTAQT